MEFDLQKQKSFGLAQIYTGLKRIKTYDNLYRTGKFKKSAIKTKMHCLNRMPETIVYCSQ